MKITSEVVLHFPGGGGGEAPPELAVEDLRVEVELAHKPPDLNGVGTGHGGEDHSDQDGPEQE